MIFIKEKVKAELENLLLTNPQPKNEALIRNLCQNILTETAALRLDKAGRNDALKAEKECLCVLNQLERNKILLGTDEDYMPFYKFDLPLLIRNAVCACDVALNKPEITLKNSPYSPFYAVCSEKLMTRAVCEIVLYFYKSVKKCEVLFTTTNIKSHIIISAEMTHFNQFVFSESESTFSLLRKTADIHGGSFFSVFGKDKLKLCISIPVQNTTDTPYHKTKSYIDMLSDRTGSVYIIFSELM